jgi:hypothetical protein
MSEFRFRTALDQTLLLGRKARNVKELREGIETVPDASIYHHTHRFLQQHHFLSPEPPNDFAYWIAEVINDARLAEAISSIDVVQFNSLGELRNAFVRTIQDNLDPEGGNGNAPPGHEFHFMASKTFVLSTPYSAGDLAEFLDALRHVSVGSLYHHIFEAKLRLERGENDFSHWFRDNGLPSLADKVTRLDPYSYTLEGLRNEILKLGRRYAHH